MTRKEAVEFLANTKVYVNGKSKEIQKKLFSLGHEWSPSNHDAIHFIIGKIFEYNLLQSKKKEK